MVSRYVHFENIRRFEDMLLTEPSSKRRTLILGLLAEERAKDIETPAKAPPAGEADLSADGKL